MAAKTTREGKSSPDDGVYYDPLEDPTRPRYPRPPGEIGMVIDVYDAVPVNPKEFHSHHVLLTNITDRLLEELRTFPLEAVKGVFVEKDLLPGVIFEQIHRGIILSVSLESPEALEALWAAHARNDVCRLLQETLITPEICHNVGVKQLDLRVRLWDDERDACQEELISRCHSKRLLRDRRDAPGEDTAGYSPGEYWVVLLAPYYFKACIVLSGVMPICCHDASMDSIIQTLQECIMMHEDSTATALAMVEKVRQYKKKIPDQIWQLRDEQAKFEGALSEMLRCLKKELPQNQQTIATLQQYDQCCEALRAKGVNMGPFMRYRNIIETTRKVLTGITSNVYYPITQIHVSLESEKQQQHKKSIREITQKTFQKMENDFAFTPLRHSEWHNRLLAKEERFLGFVCLIPVVIDSIVDIDECLDEYMSGLTK